MPYLVKKTFLRTKNSHFSLVNASLDDIIKAEALRRELLASPAKKGKGNKAPAILITEIRTQEGQVVLSASQIEKKCKPKSILEGI